MPEPTSGDQIITLRGGSTVRASLAQWLIERSDSLVFSVSGDHVIVSPRERITPADDLILRGYRDEVVRLVRYCDQMAEAPL